MDAQHGLATSRQLRDASWTVDAVRHLAATTGQRPFPGVYAGHNGPLSTTELLVAAALWAGPHAALTGTHALLRSGQAIGWTTPEPTFLIPDAARHRATPGAMLRRTRRLPRTRRLDGITTVLVERAIVDAARFGEASTEQVRAATITAVQSGLTTAERLRRDLSEGRRNSTLGVRLGLDDLLAGAWSLPEVWLERALRGGRPRRVFLANPELRAPDGAHIGIPDAYLPDVGVAIQVHSRAFHDGWDADGRSRWEATVEADARYAAHGVVVIGVAPTTLQDHPARFLARLDEVVAAQAGRLPPPVVVCARRLSA